VKYLVARISKLHH